MAKKSAIAIVEMIVDQLAPLSSEERQRVIEASLTLLGEAHTKDLKLGGPRQQEEGSDDNGTVPARAKTWMKQHGVMSEELNQIFHFGDNGVEIIASEIPGKNNREKVRNAYVVLGIARLLSSGNAKFDDKAARTLCETFGFYDFTNHMKYMKGGNEFTGSKDQGWTLTAPGLKHGAKLVKQLSTKND
jgi:hypothetical protein